MVRRILEDKTEKARREKELNSLEFHEGTISFHTWDMRDEYFRGLIEAYTDVLDLLD